MKAMILAAGLGTRMRPLTNHTPKPLLEVGGKPLILWHIEALREAGFKEIVVNVAYLAEEIIEYLGDGSRFGVEITISNESKSGALETAGGIIKALPLLSETFLVLNGDVWCNYSYNREFVLKENSLAHLVLVDNPKHNPKGDFKLDGTNEVYTFSGIAYYSKAFFLGIQEGKQPLAPLLFSQIEKQRVTMEHFNGLWYDIGTPERLRELDFKLSQKK